MYLEKFRLDGKVALITGGTRGIGLAIAEAFGEAGARLVLSSRGPSRPSTVIAALQSRGYAVDWIAGDMNDLSSPGAVVASTFDLAGRVDILVNNHGMNIDGETAEYPWTAYRELMNVNLDSVFLCCQAVLEPMKAQGGGVILNIGSISGIISNVPQRQVAYNTSKAAVHHLTKSLASDYAADNIRVNAIAPGYITTDMTNRALADPVKGAMWRSLTPMGRAGDAEEIAAGALYLCSPAASYVTGEVLVIDGGYTAR